MFWRFVDHLCKLFIFLASAGGVCVVAAGQDPTGVGWCAASALATFALEAFAVQGKVTFAVRQCQRYATILTLFPIDGTEETPALFKRIRNERLMVEKDETVVLECLDVLCHNRQYVAEGRNADVASLTWFQRTVGSVLPFGYRAG